MHDNPVKRNGGRESVTRQFAMLQAVVVGNPEKILATLGRQAQTRFLLSCSRKAISGPPTRHEGRISYDSNVCTVTISS